jgi:hypothetical protein
MMGDQEYYILVLLVCILLMLVVGFGDLGGPNDDGQD